MKVKETTTIDTFGGLNEHAFIHKIAKEQFKALNNVIADERGMLYARDGTKYYPSTKKILHWEVLEIQGKGLCVIIEVQDGSDRKIYWSQDLTTTWLDADHLICTMDYNVYPCQFLEFKGRLWITDGMSSVKIWDGIECVDLSDKAFMRGRYMVKFRGKIWMLHTPESGYNIVQGRFTDDDDFDVEMSDEDAWSGLNITALRDCISIVGARPLSDTVLAIYSKGGVFGLRVEGKYATDFYRMADIRCVEGHYNKHFPVVFSEDKKGYIWTGSNWKLLDEIEDTLKDDTNNPFPLEEEIFVVSTEDFNQGHFDTNGATAGWGKDVLTPGYTFDEAGDDDAAKIAKGFKDEKWGRKGDTDGDENTNTPIYHDSSHACAQSFTVVPSHKYGADTWEWNLCKRCKGVSIWVWRKSTGDETTFRVELVKFENPPVLASDYGEVLAYGNFTTETEGIQHKYIWWNTPVNLEVGKQYYIRVWNTPGDNVDHRWQTNDAVYAGGKHYSASGLRITRTASFTIWYARHIGNLAGGNSYYSPVFTADDIVKGKLFSVAYEMGHDTDFRIFFRSSTSSFDWDDDPTAGPSWDDNVWDITHGEDKIKTNCFLLDLADRITSTKKYFQYRIEFYPPGQGTYPLGCIPKIYGVKIQYQTQEGIIKTFTNDTHNWLMLKNSALVLTPAGWYKIYDYAAGTPQKLMLDSMILWENELWMSTGADQTPNNEYYYLKFEEAYTKDYDNEAGFERDIWMTVKSGALDCGCSKNDKGFRRMRILEEIKCVNVMPLKVEYSTEKGDGTLDTTPPACTPIDSPHIKLWEEGFGEDTHGKWIILTITQKKALVRKIKEIELQYFVERIDKK